MLPRAIAAQGLQPIAGWDAEIVQTAGGMQQQQLAADNPFDRRKTPDRPAVEQKLGVSLCEGSDHGLENYSE